MQSNKMSVRQRVQAKKDEKRKQKRIQFSDFKADWQRNPMIMIGLFGSGFLTALSGLFIGLAPKLDQFGNLQLFGGVPGYGAMAMGIFFGLLYAATFPIIGEFGTYYWHRKASLRDEGNRTQAFVGYGMLAITFTFMVATAIAASYILASLLHTFTAFNAIPEWAQKWTVLIIPIALALHAGANMWYDHVSEYAEERREMERTLMSAKNEAEARIRQARIAAEERVAITMADEYERVSEGEAVKAGKNLAQKAWKEDKKRFGGDDDGDGILNVVDTRNDNPQFHSAPPRNEPVVVPANGRHHDTENRPQ